MIRSRFKASLIILFVCTVLVPLTNPLLGNMNAGSFTFSRTPSGYNNQTGAFTLGKQAYGSYYGKFDSLCLAYDYFQFNVTSGQVVNGQLNSPGQNIYYAILTSSQYRTFDINAQNCIITLGSARVQVFNAKTTLTWTTPEAGQYALMFFTLIDYTGPVYFIQ